MKNKSTLTERENEILNLIIEEYSTKEISEKLDISTRTVDAHRRKIIQKTESKNIIGAIKRGLVLRILSNNK